MLRIEKVEVQTRNNVRIIMPADRKLSEEEETALERAVIEIEQATNEEVYAVYLNPDNNNPEKLHDYKFVLRKNI